MRGIKQGRRSNNEIGIALPKRVRAKPRTALENIDMRAIAYEQIVDAIAGNILSEHGCRVNKLIAVGDGIQKKILRNRGP